MGLTRENIGGLLWAIWFVFFVGVGILSIFYFRKNPNANLKRRFHTAWTIGYGVTFFLLVVFSIGASPALLLFAPVVAAIIYFNIRNTTFCVACGKSFYNHFFATKLEYCARCGARLPQKTTRV